MSSYTISIPVIQNVNKTYTVEKKKVNNNIYPGDISGIAFWFYSNNIEADNINIIIYGNFHSTFPNPPHLSVEITYGGYNTGKLHMSVDANGYWFAQPMSGGEKKLKAKKSKTRKLKN
mgnify:CR=1 FL=1